MAVLTVTAADVAPVKIVDQDTFPPSEAIDAGEVGNLDSNGELRLADASSAALAGNLQGIALRSANQAGVVGVTIMRKGIVYLGAALDALAFDAPVYLSDTTGKLDSAAGTTSVVIGHVVPVWADETTPQKCLRIDL